MNASLRNTFTLSRVSRLAALGISTLAALSWAAGAAEAQSLMVLPVNIQMAPGQGAATLTVMNKGDAETSVQLRAYGWDQPQGGDDQLTPSDEILLSPPMATIAPGGSQVVRIILRKKPQAKESTYRIVLDQIPPPAEPGVVRVVLRMSMPVFAQPSVRALPHVQFHLEREGDKSFLVASNDGTHHEAVRDIVLMTGDGRKLKMAGNTSPYVLAGSVRRWPIVAPDTGPVPETSLHLTAKEDSGVIEQQVQVVGAH